MLYFSVGSENFVVEVGDLNQSQGYVILPDDRLGRYSCGSFTFVDPDGEFIPSEKKLQALAPRAWSVLPVDEE
jgi:hypothetical protein